MAVNLEIKGMLAKCLAMEDIIIEHKNVETASFNVHTRVLTLPMWEKVSDNVYTMLVLHEISHALWTPDIDWTKEYKIPGPFVNIVEDARIEKLCKRKYPGSPKSFYAGYKELVDEDFFAIAGEDISKMNLADRANLYFKIGGYVDIPIKDGIEKEIIDEIKKVETFDDVLLAAKKLYDYCKEQQDNTEDFDMKPNSSESGNSSEKSQQKTENKEEGNNSDSDNSEQFEGESDENGKENDNTVVGGVHSQEPKVKTMDSLEDSIKKLASMGGSENVYLEIPKLDLDKVIISNSECHSHCTNMWNEYDDNSFSYPDGEFLKFKKSAQKEVNYLVKEFECKKSADSYARATESKTGVLDCTKLHTYKYSEDLFKKVTTLADGKNHGLVFILDWSGSMGNVMIDTLKQLFNLTWFCKKVSIPFEVYAFTNDYPKVKYDENGEANLRIFPYEPKDGKMCVGDWFSLMNILTSKTSNKVLEEQMKNIWRVAHYYNSYASYNCPVGWGLSGTPLNESLISLHQILPKFKQENKLQKVQCVVLTDGEAGLMKYHCEVFRSWDKEPYLGYRTIGTNSFLRDRKTGNVYSFGQDWNCITKTLLENLKDNFSDVNFIGIRVLNNRDASNFIRMNTNYNSSEYEKTMVRWKKEKAFSLSNSGYDSYFGVSSTALSQNAEFEVAECATKTQIKSAFVKSLRSKKMNKKILNEFIGFIV